MHWFIYSYVGDMCINSGLWLAYVVNSYVGGRHKPAPLFKVEGILASLVLVSWLMSYAFPSEASLPAYVC